MDPLTPLRDYGWLGVLVVFALREFWPWISQRFSKEQDTNINRTMVAIQEEQAQRAEERQARAAERTFRHEIDERQARAYEKLAESQQQTTALLATMNERINQVATGQATMTAFMVEAVTDMRERVAEKYPVPKPSKKSGGAPVQ